MKLTHTKRLAKDLMTQHGLKGWSFTFDRAVRRLGLCLYSKRTISLSRSLTLLNQEPQVRNTILHEIAHALVGVDHGHNNVWRSKALSIGCNGERQTNSIVRVTPKFKIVCGLCLTSWDCHRKPRNLENSWHITCGRPSKGRLTIREVG